MPNFKQSHGRAYQELSDQLSRRELGEPLGPTTLTYKGVIGIAIGGAVFIFALACLALVRYARIRDHRERNQMLEEVPEAEEQMDFKTAILRINAPDVIIARRLSSNAYEPRGGRIVYSEWEGIDNIQDPGPIAKGVTAEHKTYSRSSRIRESWPLTNIPLSILPTQSTMILNQVAPPGYIVAPESKWPRRHGSRHSRSRVTIPSPQSSSQSLAPEPVTPASRPRRPVPQRRHTSEIQLTAILRSTSQRLKSFGRLSESPPKHRLPTPPVRRNGPNGNESWEELIETSFFESPDSSVILAYMQTPSPKRSDRKDPDNLNSNERKSIAPSAISDDSLCEMELTDMMMPGLLSSPNKKTNPATPPTSTFIKPTLNEKHNRELIPTGKYLSTQESESNHLGQKQISSICDPFIQGHRPICIRKSTFGQKATTERPVSHASPLQDVSGNVQHPQRASAPYLSMSPDTNDSNPFQWSPQASNQERPRQGSPQRPGLKPKRHQQSEVNRMSNLSRPDSTISVGSVLQEWEDNPLELNFKVPPTAPLRLSRLIKSPSPSPTASPRRVTARPPSLAIFNPTLTIPDLKAHSIFNSDNRDTQNSYSPTRSADNYYRELSGNSEEDFFNSKLAVIPVKNANRSGIPKQHVETPTRTKSNTENRSVIPALSSSEPEAERLISFAPPLPSSRISLARPLSKIIVSQASLQCSPTILTPILLTMPVPGHLTGPRLQQISGPSSPSIDSLHMSVRMLRRMNSEISCYSIGSDTDLASPSRSSEPSPQMPRPLVFKRLSSTNEEPRGRSRSSRNYLSMGSMGPVAADTRGSRATISHSGAVRNSRVLGTRDRRHSNDVYKERRWRRVEQQFSDADLKTVRELASPEIKPRPGLIELNFPILSSEGPILQSPPRNPTPDESPVLPHKNFERWSDVMTKPVQKSVRRESMIESPLPKSPRLFNLENKGLGLELGNGRKTSTADGKSRFAKPSLPGSPGLYDADGFLKSSPFRSKEEEP